MNRSEAQFIQREIRKLPLNEAVIPEIAALLGGSPRIADFKLRDETVIQLDVPSDCDRAPTVLTFWPSLRRVDAMAEGIVAIFTDVVAVDLVEGVEVLFRRQSGEYLIVAIGGKVIVRS